MNSQPIAWHCLTVTDVAKKLESSHTGLSTTAVRDRQAQYGPNELQAGTKVSAWQILLEQFKNVLLLILIVATVLSIATGHGTESIIIGVIVFFAVALGFFQEYRAERAMEALNKMAAPMAIAIRDGEENQLPARELVPGDVIVMKAGDKVPADCRIIETHNVQADEAALTGESLPSANIQNRLRALRSQPVIARICCSPARLLLAAVVAAWWWRPV